MGTEESVSVLRQGDICLDTRGCLVRVMSNEFPYEHEGWVWGGFLSNPVARTLYPSDALTRIDPAFYKLLGIEEHVNESPTG